MQNNFKFAKTKANKCQGWNNCLRMRWMNQSNVSQYRINFWERIVSYFQMVSFQHFDCMYESMNFLIRSYLFTNSICNALMKLKNYQNIEIIVAIQG